jgi:hypothetical protein
VQTIDREIGCEHATLDTEGVDGLEHIRPDALDRPGVVDHAEAADLGIDVRLGRQRAQAVNSLFDRFCPKSPNIPALLTTRDWQPNCT